MMRLAVLVDESDKRLGTLTVGPSTFVISYRDAIFYRTEKVAKLHHSHRVMAIVFEQTEIFNRNHLAPI